MSDKNDDLDLDMSAIAARTPSDRKAAATVTDDADEHRASEDDGGSEGEGADEAHAEAEALRVEAEAAAATEAAELAARDALAKAQFEKSLAEAEASKVDEHGPTLSVSLTPVPPAPKAEETEAIGSMWESDGTSVKPDQDKIGTAEHVAAQVQPAVSVSEPSVVVTPSLVPDPPAAAAQPPAPAPQPVPNNSMPGQTRTQIRVGRAPDNDWVIENPVVSKHHALLTLNEGSIKIEDLGSTGGTYVGNEQGGWTRVVQGSPVTVKVGQRFSFGSVVVNSTRDAQNQTNLHFIQKDGKLSASQMFFLDGEQLSEMHRKEQERLNAAEAAKPKPPTTAEQEAKRPLKSPTAMQQSIARGNSDGSGLGRALGIGMLVIGAAAVLLLGLYWAANHLDFGRRPVVATTETETSTESETTSPTPTETAETDTSTPSTDPGYTCRPGSEVATCNRVADFVLARADGASYWDCSGITADQYHDLYTVEDPTGSRNIVMNTCACQLCEPTATP
ncbi:FHA domain-containing protein [Candidatus Uhrbacteria bacterium]|nr:FHA domain-containing protein [Candidatus Uhrbacteria bacterium]